MKKEVNGPDLTLPQMTNFRFFQHESESLPMTISDLMKIEEISSNG